MVGGQEMRMWTSRAPALRTMRTILRLVVPRTMESSTSTTLLPSSRLRIGIELELHAEVADGLRGLDERAADVVIADQSLAVGQAGFGGITERGGVAGIGHGHDDIGRRPGLRGRAGMPMHLARILHGAAEDDGIRTREIDVLEDALRARLFGSVAFAGDAFGPDDHHLAGLHIVEVDGVDQIERAGFRGEDVGRVCR